VACRTRGRAGAVSEAVDEDLLRELQQRVVEMLNGDVRTRRVVHFCRNGCCAHAREAAVKIADLLITSIVSSLGTSQPSTSRWHTYEESMVPQAALLMLHQLGSRFQSSPLSGFPLLSNIESWFQPITSPMGPMCQCILYAR
jgi:hypothetical protein